MKLFQDVYDNYQELRWENWLTGKLLVMHSTNKEKVIAEQKAGELPFLVYQKTMKETQQTVNNNCSQMR